MVAARSEQWEEVRGNARKPLVRRVQNSAYRPPYVGIHTTLNTENSEVLSPVLPVMVAALVCDTHAVDPSTGKKSLIGIFDRVNAAKFPVSRPITLYYKLTDAQGRYEFEIRYSSPGGEDLLAKATGKFTSKDRLKAMELVVPFPKLPLPAPGRYEFQFWANGMYIGTTSIDAAGTGAG